MLDNLPFRPAELQNYMESCWVEGYFTPEEVAQISGMYEANAKAEAEVTGNISLEPKFRKSTVSFVKPGEKSFQNIMQKLGGLAIQLNHQHFNFDLLGFYEDIQIAEYGVEDFFEWHADFGNTVASIRKLSLSVQLTDPSEYEGGDLQFMVNQKTVNAPKTLGTVIIFPSYQMHKVTPITRGRRRSMVGWVSGTPFR